MGLGGTHSAIIWLELKIQRCLVLLKSSYYQQMGRVLMFASILQSVSRLLTEHSFMARLTRVVCSVC